MLKWLRRSMGGSKGGMTAVMGAIDDIANPGAARATQILKEQNERVIPVPSPGDRLFSEGKITIVAHKTSQDERAL